MILKYLGLGWAWGRRRVDREAWCGGLGLGLGGGRVGVGDLWGGWGVWGFGFIGGKGFFFGFFGVYVLGLVESRIILGV